MKKNKKKRELKKWKKNIYISILYFIIYDKSYKTINKLRFVDYATQSMTLIEAQKSKIIVKMIKFSYRAI